MIFQRPLTVYQQECCSAAQTFGAHRVIMKLHLSGREIGGAFSLFENVSIY
jgi:hypothetical protein